MKDTARLRRRILSRTLSVGVIGQGYVGLSLACASAKAGFGVVGTDVHDARIHDLQQGILPVPGVWDDDFREAVATGRMTFTTDPGALKECEILTICVPTPVRDHTPDLSFVEAACTEVAKHLSPGRLVVLESTTYPGTTEDIVRPILEKSDLRAGRDFLLAYSPERIDPGNQEFTISNTPRIVGGLTPEATGLATLFYEQLVEKVVPVSSTRAAELAKLLENTFRHVNVALVNEMAMICHEMGIDVWEVVDAAATKPFGFMPFYPGPGVGGHCIPVDPTYLAWQVQRSVGHQFRILEQARDVNSQMPRYVATRIGDALNDAGKAVRGASIMILGVAYKADVGDVREAPALEIVELLEKRGAKVMFHDPFIDSLTVDGRVLKRAELTHQTISGADCVAILTPHRAYDVEWIADHASLVFDARGAVGPGRRPNLVRL